MIMTNTDKTLPFLLSSEFYISPFSRNREEANLSKIQNSYSSTSPLMFIHYYFSHYPRSHTNNSLSYCYFTLLYFSIALLYCQVNTTVQFHRFKYKLRCRYLKFRNVSTVKTYAVYISQVRQIDDNSSFEKEIFLNVIFTRHILDMY